MPTALTTSVSRVISVKGIPTADVFRERAERIIGYFTGQQQKYYKLHSQPIFSAVRRFRVVDGLGGFYRTWHTGYAGVAVRF